MLDNNEKPKNGILRDILNSDRLLVQQVQIDDPRQLIEPLVSVAFLLQNHLTRLEMISSRNIT